MEELRRIIKASPVLMRTLKAAQKMSLPDWWIVSGAVYNQVWNDLTGRAEMYGVTLFGDTPPVEIRNQARVHLWYKDHFGRDCPQYRNSRHGIDHFACKTHCVGVSFDGDLDIYAPFGLNDIFSFRLTPNTALDNRETHEAKAARQSALWPELEVIPWPD